MFGYFDGIYVRVLCMFGFPGTGVGIELGSSGETTVKNTSFHPSPQEAKTEEL